MAVPGPFASQSIHLTIEHRPDKEHSMPSDPDRDPGDGGFLFLSHRLRGRQELDQAAGSPAEIKQPGDEESKLAEAEFKLRCICLLSRQCRLEVSGADSESASRERASGSSAPRK